VGPREAGSKKVHSNPCPKTGRSHLGPVTGRLGRWESEWLGILRGTHFRPTKGLGGKAGSWETTLPSELPRAAIPFPGISGI